LANETVGDERLQRNYPSIDIVTRKTTSHKKAARDHCVMTSNMHTSALLVASICIALLANLTTTAAGKREASATLNFVALTSILLHNSLTVNISRNNSGGVRLRRRAERRCVRRVRAGG
jgi:hypothetical protein